MALIEPVSARQESAKPATNVTAGKRFLFRLRDGDVLAPIPGGSSEPRVHFRCEGRDDIARLSGLMERMATSIGKLTGEVESMQRGER